MVHHQADLEAIRVGWDQAAREDALFNILSDYPRNPDEFFKHGVAEVDAMVARLVDLGVAKNRRRALDFGCGVGRLTQALARHYESVDGVDISSEMIDRARNYNSYEKSVAFHVNVNDDLALFGDDTFDLVYTNITLQHMPAELAKGYVQEFVRVLSADGLAVFEIPEGPNWRHPNSWQSMHCSTRTDVESWVTEAGAVLLDIEVSQMNDWLCCTYTAKKGKATA